MNDDRREELRTEEQVSLTLRRELEATRRAKAENDARHRITIADLRKYHHGAVTDRDAHYARVQKLRAIIERVRVLVDSPRPASKTEVLAALEGDQG